MPTFNGTSGNDAIAGTTTDDTINGLGGNDTLWGSFGDDLVYGGEGDDTILGSPGADSLDGGAGVDTLSYASSQAGINVLLSGPTQSVASTADNARGDRIAGFERFIGTAFVDTFFVDNDKTIEAGGGADSIVLVGSGSNALFGQAGDDLIAVVASTTQTGSTFDGGTGMDTLRVFNVGVQDLRDDTVQNFETFEFQRDSADITVRMLASQAAQFSTFSALGSFVGNKVSLEIDMGAETSIDLSSATINNFLGFGTGFVFNGDADAETIIGTSVRDRLIGAGGNDILSGSGGDDNLSGGDGNDTLTGGNGVDFMRGGSGYDIVDFADNGTSGVVVDLAGGGVRGLFTDAFGNQDSVNRGDVEAYRGTSADDTITGDRNGGDHFAFDADFFGEGGNDVLTGSGTAQLLDGGTGNDTLRGLGGDDTLLGGAGNDTMEGGAGADSIAGGAGYDIVDFADNGVTGAFVDLAGAGTAGIWRDAFGNNDTVDRTTVEAYRGTSAADFMLGDGGNGTNLLFSADFFGEGGNDILIGSGAAQLLNGGTGDDALRGLGGDDTLRGGTGSDTIEGGVGADSIDGGTGIDTASYANSSLAVSIDLSVGTAQISSGDAAGDRLSGIENLIGSTHDDFLVGNSVANTLTGGSGNDTIEGGAGGDSLDGGAGTADVLSYATETTGVTVNLSNGTTGGAAAGDTISNFESLVGTGQRDILEGIAGTVLYGGDGQDFLSSQVGGADLFGGDGDDVHVIVLATDVTGRTFDGGANRITGLRDTLTVISNNSVPLDFRGASVLNMETLAIDDRPVDVRVQFTAGQVQQFLNFIETPGTSPNTRTVEVFMDTSTSVDLSGASVTGYAQPGSGFIFNGDSDAETITGSLVSDTVLGSGGADIIYGGGGNDVLDGGFGFNTVDQIFGGAGDDLIRNLDGFQSETLDGGAGVDTLLMSPDRLGSVTIYDLVAGTAGFASGSFSDTIRNFENLIGHNGNERVVGTSGANTISTNGGSDTVDGGLGNDNLDGGADVDTISFASAAAASSVVTAGARTINLGARVDLSNQGTAQDTQYGTDTFTNFENAEGTNFVDFLTGDDGANNLYGGGDGDLLTGAGGADALYGGDGFDVLVGGAGADSLFGGDGAGDIAAYFNETGPLVFDMRTVLTDAANISSAVVKEDIIDFTTVEGYAGATNHSNTFHTEGAAPYILGGEQSDTFFGGAGVDQLLAQGGNDLVVGGLNSDALFGDGGNDDLWGGLQGGTGDGASDFFFFDNADGNDVIHDFEAGLDKIWFYQDGIENLGQLTFSTIDGDTDGADDDAMITYQAAGLTSTIRVLNTTEAELMSAGTILF